MFRCGFSGVGQNLHPNSHSLHKRLTTLSSCIIPSAPRTQYAFVQLGQGNCGYRNIVEIQRLVKSASAFRFN